MANQHVSFVVEGMASEDEAECIKSSLTNLNGVYEVYVDITARRVAVEYDGERLDIQTLRGKLEDSGCKVR